MKFNRTTPTEQFHTRWISEEGRWEIGFYKVMYGQRVRMGAVEGGGCMMDLCCGTDVALLNNVLIWVRVLVARYPETVSESQIEEEFPIPIACKPFMDLRLRTKLEEAAAEELVRLSRKKVRTG